MAEEHLGFAFGAFGALVDLKDSIKEGLEFWQRIQSSDQSIKRFKILLDLQQSRFLYWAQEWGIEHHQQIENPQMGMHQVKLAAPYLEQIQRTTRELWNDFKAIVPKFTENQSNNASETVHQPIPSTFSGPHSSDKLDAKSTSGEKTNWVWHEKRLNDGMILLRSLLDELYACFPIQNNFSAGHMLYVTSLKSQDPSTLAQVGHVIDDPLQQGLAFSKALAHMPPSGQTYVWRPDPAKLIKRESVGNRFLGTYDGKPVLVERKSSKVPKTAISQSDILNARIENIIMRLQHEKKPTQLRTLTCYGAINNSYSDGDACEWFVTDYNIVYKIDTPVFFTLRKLLSGSNSDKSGTKDRKTRAKAGISLGRRFIIAQTLASAVLCLHIADWLHKAIRSENILFFAANITEVGSTLPYLVGFEYSRPDAPDERTEDVVDDKERIYYRHPEAHAFPVADSQQPLGGAGRYSKVYDIYSLGVVLMELGLFKSAKTIVRNYLGHGGPIPSANIRKILLGEGIADLKFHMGEVYANATCACLDGSFDRFDKYDLPMAFSKLVVRPLNNCQA